MAQELVAFRLYAPYFGYSVYVWGSMIATVMAALAIGYGVGGWIADRSQTDLPLYAIILGSALYQLVILFVVQSVLLIFGDLGDLTGVIIASLIIFTPPMTAMATTGPFLIRALAAWRRIGWAAGTIYAISTAGSIAGILGTGFFLVPHLGTHKTLVVFCVISAPTTVAVLPLHYSTAMLCLACLPWCCPWCRRRAQSPIRCGPSIRPITS
jgi:hypothetical protein